jgi:peptide/nickel transport system substrate-binding protein
MLSQRGDAKAISAWAANRRVSRRRILGWAAAGLAAGLAACGNRASRNGSSAGQASGSQAATPQQGGVLRLRTTKDFFDFDTSGGGKSSPNDSATTLVYETLVGFRRDPSLAYTDMEAVPRLAQSWETPDAQTFTFHLRTGIKWANLAPVNGRPLTAADVKWTFEYASRTGAIAGDKKLPPASFGFLLEQVAGVQTPDDRTVVIRFNEPYAPFVNYNYDRALQIVPHEIYDQDGNFSNRMAGTGPFLLDPAASQHGSRWVFKKNPDYWQSGKPHVNEIDYLVVSDDPSAYAAFQAGQLDILSAVVDAKAATVIQKAVPAAGMQQYATPSAHGIFLNLAKPPFNDPRMRKAVALSVDHDEFDKTFGSGSGQWPALCALPDWLSPQEAHQLLPYDPTQAKQLLAAAGYPNGLPLDYTDKTPQWSAEIQLLQAQLKKVGITVNIKAADAAASFTALHTGAFTLFPTANSIEGDMDYLLFENFYSKSTGDLTGAKDPKLDSMLLGQRRETDPAKRLALLKDISRYMTQNNFQLNLYYPQGFTFWAAKVKGYTDHWQQQDANAPDIWLQQA